MESNDKNAELNQRVRIILGITAATLVAVFVLGIFSINSFDEIEKRLKIN